MVGETENSRFYHTAGELKQQKQSGPLYRRDGAGEERGLTALKKIISSGCPLGRAWAKQSCVMLE